MNLFVQTYVYILCVNETDLKIWQIIDFYNFERHCFCNYENARIHRPSLVPYL